MAHLIRGDFMTHLRLVALAALLSLAQSLGAATTENGPETFTSIHTQYDALLEFFEAGQLPNEESMVGLWTGRCYLQSNPSKPFGMVLAARRFLRREVTEDHGPAFPAPAPQYVLNFGLFNHSGHRELANRYDNLSPQDRMDMERIYTSPFFLNMVSTVVDNARESEYREGNLRYSLRQHKGYFVVIARVLRSSGQYIEGDIFNACYFFKKVGN